MRGLTKARRGTVLGAAALTAGSATFAQEVSGAFEATKVTIALRYVCAYPVCASFDPDLKGIAVMLSEGPVDLDMLNLVEMNRTPSGWVFRRAVMVGMY